MTNRVLWVLTDHAETVAPWVERANQAGFDVQVGGYDALTALPEKWTNEAIVLEWLASHDNVKQTALAQCDFAMPPEALILTASHQRMVTELAAGLKAPQRVVGFCPMGLYRGSEMVSLARSMQVTEAACAKADAFFEVLGLHTQWIADTPGMVLPRVYAMLANEAAFALQAQVATAVDIDTAMCLGTNYPVGPLAWADQVGLDVVLDILNTLWTTYREERYRPCLLLQKRVLAGQIGVKSGQGFFAYPNSPAATGAGEQKVKVL